MRDLLAFLQILQILGQWLWIIFFKYPVIPLIILFAHLISWSFSTLDKVLFVYVLCWFYVRCKNSEEEMADAPLIKVENHNRNIVGILNYQNRGKK